MITLVILGSYLLGSVLSWSIAFYLTGNQMLAVMYGLSVGGVLGVIAGVGYWLLRVPLAVKDVLKAYHDGILIVAIGQDKKMRLLPGRSDGFVIRPTIKPYKDKYAWAADGESAYPVEVGKGMQGVIAYMGYPHPLADRTSNGTYREAVDYLMTHWFHYSKSKGWYYYRYKSLQDAPSEYWYKGYLYDKQPYAQGYFLHALSDYYWNDSKLLVSANKNWALLSDELWELTWENASETNVETQSSTATGLAYYLYALARNLGAGVEYVRGGYLLQLNYTVYRSLIKNGLKFTMSKLYGLVEKPTVLQLRSPSTSLLVS